MAEYIERKSAIDAIYERQFKEHCRNYAVDDDPIYERYLAYRDAMAIVKDLPSADVAPVRHGKWIEDEFNHKLFFCSECGEPYMSYLVGDSPRWNYCPNCGAEMEVDGDV